MLLLKAAAALISGQIMREMRDLRLTRLTNQSWAEAGADQSEAREQVGMVSGCCLCHG